MIRYALQCEGGHGFESWFRDGEAYENQARAGLLACPACGSTTISKQIMAPALAIPADASARMVEVPDDKVHDMRAFLRAFRRQLEATAEDVGTQFAEEARKIHYGETEERLIFGLASPTDARELNEEGIDILPVPMLPEEQN